MQVANDCLGDALRWSLPGCRQSESVAVQFERRLQFQSPKVMSPKTIRSFFPDYETIRNVSTSIYRAGLGRALAGAGVRFEEETDYSLWRLLRTD